MRGQRIFWGLKWPPKVTNALRGSIPLLRQLGKQLPMQVERVLGAASGWPFEATNHDPKQLDEVYWSITLFGTDTPPILRLETLTPATPL